MLQYRSKAMSLASFVHLVGSVPADTVEEAMKTVCSHLPERLYRVSDGEPGERSRFVLWQMQRVWPREVLAPMSANKSPPPSSEDKFELTMDHLPPTTGYAEHAISSYKVFCRLREAGVIPHGVKFQVCLPSPTTVVGLTLSPEFQLVGEQLYESLLTKDLRTIQDEIPHRDLAIQFDVLAELCFMEHIYGEKRKPLEWFFNQLTPYFEPVRDGVISRMARLALPVQPDVELGLHICYGDATRQHFVQPTDAGLLAEVIEIAIQNVPHPIAWIHIPVPKDRTDEAYLEPLKSLVGNPGRADLTETKLVLGLVHANDAEGTSERLATARKVLPSVTIGVSTECGLGRVPKEELCSILQILKDHSEVH